MAESLAAADSRNPDASRASIEDSEAPPLIRLVGRSTLQQLQEHFAALGRMSVCIAGIDGELITRPTWGSRYSEMIGTSPRGRAALVEAIRTGNRDRSSAKLVNCHDGVQLYTTPIVHGGTVLALLAVGTRTHAPPTRPQIERLAAAYGLPVEDLATAAGDLDPRRGGTVEAIHRFADVLAHVMATLFAQANDNRRQLDDLRTVHELSELLSGTLDLQAILDRTVHRVVKVMPVKACGIRLLDSDSGELVIRAVHNLSEEYLRKGPVMLQDSSIDAMAFAGESVYIADAPTDPRVRYPENARREGLVSGLCVPLTYRGETIGVIRVYTGKPHVFSGSEESLLRSIGSQAAAAIIHSRLWEEQVRAERFTRQVEAAAMIQRRMLPSHAPPHPALCFGCVYDPTLQLGGDFYDFVPLPHGAVGLAIADVAGKGLPAAMLMASIRSVLRSHARHTEDIEQVVREVNRHLCHDTQLGEFATLIYGVFDAKGRTLRYCNAGHIPPLLLRDDRFIELVCGGTVIGLSSDETFDVDSVELRPGDLLVMVTDGVTEAIDFAGQAYGRERLLASIHRHRDLQVEQLARQLLWDVRRFAGLAEQSDDVTIVAAKVT